MQSTVQHPSTYFLPRRQRKAYSWRCTTFYCVLREVVLLFVCSILSYCVYFRKFGKTVLDMAFCIFKSFWTVSFPSSWECNHIAQFTSKWRVAGQFREFSLHPPCQLASSFHSVGHQHYLSLIFQINLLHIHAICYPWLYFEVVKTVSCWQKMHCFFG